jgi:hypothetical protein
MSHGIGDDGFQRLVDIYGHNVTFVRARLLQRRKLRYQHLWLEEVSVTRSQAGFDHRKIAVQIDERQVAVTGAQAIAVVLF